MNCGDPILIGLDTIQQDLSEHGGFSKWLIHKAEFPTEDLYLIAVSKEDDIWKEAERHRRLYYERVKALHKDRDIESLIRKVKRQITKKAIIETSHGSIQRDPVIVLTRPLYDFATWYTYSSSDQIVIKWKRRGFIVIDLGVELANKRNLETVFSELNPCFYSHMGHGNESSIIGHGGERMISEENVYVLRNCSAHVIGCRTASLLGRVAIDQGCVSYFGYEKNFLFMTQYNAMSLAYNMFRGLRKIGETDARNLEDTLRVVMKRLLIHDRDALRLLGDENARIKYNQMSLLFHKLIRILNFWRLRKIEY